MNGWRYLAERLNGDGTATLLDVDVPLNQVSIEQNLSEPNSLTGVISPEMARMKASDGRPLFEEWSTAIYAEKDGDIRGAGILAHSGFAKSQWTLECVGWIGYWKDMPYVGAGHTYANADPLDIVRDIIDVHVQDRPGSNVALIPSSHLSGKRTGTSVDEPAEGVEGLASQAYRLAFYQDHDLLDNITNLAGETPFDFIETHHWQGDQIQHHLRFGVPLGRRRDDLRFAVGENVYATPEVYRAGEDYASEVHTLGAGEGASMVRGVASAPRGQRLRRVAIASRPSLRSISQAAAASRADLQWRQRLESVESIVVRDTPHAPLGSFDVGDEIYVTGQAGWMEIDDWFRILSIRITPDSPSAVELSVQRSDRITG